MKYFIKNSKQDAVAVCRVQLLGRRTLHTVKLPWSELKPETTVITVIKLHYG